MEKDEVMEEKVDKVCQDIWEAMSEVMAQDAKGQGQAAGAYAGSGIFKNVKDEAGPQGEMSK